MPDIPQTVPAPLREIPKFSDETKGMVTVSGQWIDYLNPDPAAIVPQDIAVHLERNPRFQGATSRPWNGLDHTLYCDDIAVEVFHASDELRGDVLLHDAHEFATGDPTTGLKRCSPGICVVQARLDVAIRLAYGLGSLLEEQRALIKRIDTLALLGEAREYMGQRFRERLRERYGEPPAVRPTYRGRGVAIAEFKARCYEVGLRIVGEDE